MIRAASQHPALQPSQRRPLSVMLALAFAVLAATVVTALRNHLRPPHHRTLPAEPFEWKQPHRLDRLEDRTLSARLHALLLRIFSGTSSHGNLFYRIDCRGG